MTYFLRLGGTVAITFGVTIGAAFAATMVFNADQNVSSSGPNHAPYGFVSSLSVNGKALATDMSFPAPSGSRSPTSPVVAVVKLLSWDGAATAPIKTTFNLSAANAATLKAAMAASRLLAITGHVTLYRYDPVSAAWFKAFDCGMAGRGLTANSIVLIGDIAQMSVPGSGSCTIEATPTNTIVKPAGTPTP